MKRALIVVGLPYSGKNYYYERYYSHMKLLDVDSYVESEESRYMQFVRDMDVFLKNGDDVCIVGVCKNMHFIDNYTKLIEAGYHITTIQLEANFFTMLKRYFLRKRKVPLLSVVLSYFLHLKYVAIAKRKSHKFFNVRNVDECDC